MSQKSARLMETVLHESVEWTVKVNILDCAKAKIQFLKESSSSRQTR